MKVTDLVASFAKPIVEAHGCELWDVEYVREGSDYFLRLYLDKEGGVDINDCEAISRAVDPVLDEKDPIPTSYHFEVCSAGLERALKRPGDFERFMGSPVTVKLYRPRNGLKEIPAVLRGYEDGRITVEAGKETITFEKSEVALVRLRVEFLQLNIGGIKKKWLERAPRSSPKHPRSTWVWRSSPPCGSWRRKRAFLLIIWWSG